MEAFEAEVIRSKYLHAPEKNRLLRKSMIDLLVEHRPTNRTEFEEDIHFWIRDTVSKNDAEFLDDVLGLVSESIELQNSDRGATADST